jgi:hypothetical protein
LEDINDSGTVVYAHQRIFQWNYAYRSISHRVKAENRYTYHSNKNQLS